MSLLDQPQTSSAPRARGGREAVATGLLLSAVFGTSAGVTWRPLGNDVVGMTTVPPSRCPGTAGTTVGDEIRSLRDAVCAVGVSRQQLARLMGVDRRSVSGWASGEIRPVPERVAALRALALTVAEMDAERPGRVPYILGSQRGTTTLLDAVATGRAKLESWRSWLGRSAATVTVTARPRSEAPIWAAAALALAEGRLAAPTGKRTVRPPSTYEMNPDEEAAAFAEPVYEGGRGGHP